MELWGCRPSTPSEYLATLKQSPTIGGCVNVFLRAPLRTNEQHVVFLLQKQLDILWSQTSAPLSWPCQYHVSDRTAMTNTCTPCCVTLPYDVNRSYLKSGVLAIPGNRPRTWIWMRFWGRSTRIESVSVEGTTAEQVAAWRCIRSATLGTQNSSLEGPGPTSGSILVFCHTKGETMFCVLRTTNLYDQKTSS